MVISGVMQDKINEFTTALAEMLKNNATPTPEEVKRLADQYTAKPKRGRPKKNKVTPQSKLSRGRPRSDESMAMKYRVMGLWVMLERVDMPQIEKRGIIAKVSNKSRAFVDKAIATLNKLVERGLAVAAYSPKTGRGLLLPIDDAERLQSDWEAGVNIDSILEDQEQFLKLELPKIVLPKIPNK